MAFGTDSFTYRAVDPSGLWSEATATLVVHGMDDWIQVTGPDQQTTLEEQSLTFSAANGNAITVIDPESPRIRVYLNALGTLTLSSTEGLEFPYPEYTNNNSTIWFEADTPAEANAALNGLVYTPYTNFAQQDWFGVYVMDLTSPPDYMRDASVLIYINVLPVNDAPVAVNDGPYTVEAGEPLVATTGGGGGGPGVLLNDYDAEGNPLSAVLVSGPAHGTLTLNADGSFTYTAEATYSGTDTFTYRASDGLLLSNPATVTITVTPRNLPPVSAADAVLGGRGREPVGRPAPGVLGNDTDPEGLPLTARLVSGPAHGTLTLNPNGSFTYTPAANYHGPDEFWYRASDGVRFGEPTHVATDREPGQRRSRSRPPTSTHWTRTRP